jgi:membrane protein
MGFIAVVSHFLQQVFSFIRFLWQQLHIQRWRQSAAALTYTSLFALVPIMTVSYVLLSLMPQLKSVQGQAEEWIFSHFLPDTGTQVSGYLQEFSHQAKSLTLPGIIILVITALMMLKTIENAFNAIWDVKQGRKGLGSFLLYWAVLSLGPILLGSALVFSTYLLSLNLLGNVEQHNLFQQIAIFLPLLLGTCALCLMYYAVPNCAVPLKYAFTGAFVTALIFGLIKNLFALSVKYSSYTLVYGAFAAVPLFLTWVYLCWMVVLFGAVLVRSLTLFPHRQYTQYSTITLTLMILRRFWLAQQKGHALSANELIQGRENQFGPLGVSTWEQLRDILMDHHFLQITADGSYVLNRDLHQVTLSDIQYLFQNKITDEALPSAEWAQEPWCARSLHLLQEAEFQQKQLLSSLTLAELFSDE